MTTTHHDVTDIVGTIVTQLCDRYMLRIDHDPETGTWTTTHDRTRRTLHRIAREGTDAPTHTLVPAVGGYGFDPLPGQRDTAASGWVVDARDPQLRAGGMVEVTVGDTTALHHLQVPHRVLDYLVRQGVRLSPEQRGWIIGWAHERSRAREADND